MNITQIASERNEAMASFVALTTQLRAAAIDAYDSGHGMTISELAHITGVSRVTLYEWLPSMKQQPLADVAATYGLTPRQIRRAVADFAAAHSGTTPYVHATVTDVTPAFVRFVASRTTKAERGPRL